MPFNIFPVDSLTVAVSENSDPGLKIVQTGLIFLLDLSLQNLIYKICSAPVRLDIALQQDYSSHSKPQCVPP